MIRQRRLIAAAIAAVCSVTLLMTACSSPSTTSASEDEGDPVSGGSASIIQVSEPRTLDPASLGNVWATQPELGNALYGTLMINNVESLDIEYKMAEDFSTTDGGASYTMKLRPGLMFTDGTPLDAAAVKYNWDRMKDPTLGSGASKVSPQIASTDVIDPATLKVTMVAPNQHFAQAVVTSALNWVASPSALEKGRASFDAAPVGAGPFTLTSWTRQNKMEFAKNPGFWDAPKPYLDSLTFTFVADAAQRYNAVISGAVDSASESNAANLQKAEGAGLKTDLVETGGGYYMAMNTRGAPFDDPRARKAVSLALNLDTLNTVVYNDAGTVPKTLFPQVSPFYSDIALHVNNKEEAQALFDELAAEGKPVNFAYTAFSTTENKQTGEALQAQLSAFDNVEVSINALDSSAINSVVANRDFQMVVTSANVLDPDTELWVSFHSKSQGNMTGISDPELDAALDAGRVGTTVGERKAAYDTVQEKIAELVPGVFFVRSTPAVIAGTNVSGVDVYGLGSPLPEEMWLTN
ncbi:peptide/nickel transport system substrate-binding protein [Williamsia limnetica]|uniref:Peptide/nickel transport system substrate-binding protein n=1 Tax=Williamsia limnetica TaxID=882452 RepID=A0A318RKS2_WILLI|nr:ABC transporter substrate-binding protein [Williamsia limnetica]PYE16269.1 peptide/nickel transport system substrate-binding protein [Williamsia limnetica]